jgi:hypothetical protein
MTRTTQKKIHSVGRFQSFNIVKDLINALPGNSSVITQEAVFSVDPTDAPIDWLDSDHVMCLL